MLLVVSSFSVALPSLLVPSSSSPLFIISLPSPSTSLLWAEPLPWQWLWPASLTSPYLPLLILQLLSQQPFLCQSSLSVFLTSSTINARISISLPSSHNTTTNPLILFHYCDYDFQSFIFISIRQRLDSPASPVSSPILKDPSMMYGRRLSFCHESLSPRST